MRNDPFASPKQDICKFAVFRKPQGHPREPQADCLALEQVQ